MEYSGQTAREMLEALREKGIVSINEKLFETDG
jgi:Na+-translocating ferredoxin:NAD+ oxidoreductase RnfC subunit